MAVLYTACVLILANTTTTRMFDYKQETIFGVNKQEHLANHVIETKQEENELKIVYMSKFQNLRSQ